MRTSRLVQSAYMSPSFIAREKAVFSKEDSFQYFPAHPGDCRVRP